MSDEPDERPRIVLASHNRGKLEELRRILVPAVPGVQVLGLGDIGEFEEPAETEWTFEGNALLKARAALAETGLPSLADDSGICVAALNGMPGVLSARWSGPAKDSAANNTLLLAQLSEVPVGQRAAEFQCAMALCTPDGTEAVEVGRMRGRVLLGGRGDGGFGYDPLFAAEGFDISTAELSPADKDAVSHRGNALRAMTPRVVAALTP